MLKKLRIPYFTFFMFSILMGCIKKDIENDISSGLIAYYPFNGSTNDESGNGNHGTGYGVELTKDRLGKNNKAYYFSAANCDTRIEANINTQSIKTGFTISFWMKSDLSEDCTGTHTLLKFGKLRDGDGGSWFRMHRDNYNKKDSFVRNSNYGGDGQRYPINNEWRHITFTFDGIVENFYLNGKFIGNDKKSSKIPYLPGNAVFGRDNELRWGESKISYTYKGSMDEIRIYDKVLNEDQIKYLSTL
jgi:hypothetical protein